MDLVPSPAYLDCPNCGQTSAIDPTVLPIQCPACKHILEAAVECNQCGKRLPYEGNPKVCSHCGGDPLGSGRKWKGPIGSVVMLLGALATIGLMAITAYILYKRFLQR